MPTPNPENLPPTGKGAPPELLRKKALAALLLFNTPEYSWGWDAVWEERIGLPPPPPPGNPPAGDTPVALVGMGLVEGSGEALMLLAPLLAEAAEVKAEAETETEVAVAVAVAPAEFALRAPEAAVGGADRVVVVETGASLRCTRCK